MGPAASAQVGFLAMEVADEGGDGAATRVTEVGCTVGGLTVALKADCMWSKKGKVSDKKAGFLTTVSLAREARAA